MRKILIFIFLVFSCDTEHEYESKNKLFLDPNNNVKLNLSDIISSFEFVGLESKDEFYIGEVWKLDVVEGNIYALDMFNSASLNKYTLEGKHIYTIDEYGQGLGRFIGPQDFVIDEENNEIIIYDAASIKLLYYNLETGLFKREKILEFRIGRFEKLNKGRFVFHLNNQVGKGFEHNIIITDSLFNVENEYLKIDNNFRRTFTYLPTNFTEYNQYIYFTQPTDYNIYRFHKDSALIESYLYVDFGDYSLPNEFFDYYESRKLRYKHAENSAYNISPYFESDNFIYMSYDFKEDIRKSRIESKLTGKIFQFSKEDLVNDIGIGPLPLWPLSVYKNKLIFLQQPIELIQYIEKMRGSMSVFEWKMFEEKNTSLLSFYNQINKDDNPYLIIAEIDF